LGTANIADELRPLAVPLVHLEALPGNPRKGDVDAIARSYVVFGQRKPVVARRVGERDGRPTGIVLAGNHQLAAAQQLGWDEIAVVWVDDDPLVVKAYALADNRTAELGGYDRGLLAGMLAEVAVDEELLAATAYSDDDLAKLVGRHESAEDESGLLTDAYEVIVTCADEAAQLALLRRLHEEGFECRALVS
jgi:ParB-like chromosome segregation protein Spo0J